MKMPFVIFSFIGNCNDAERNIMNKKKKRKRVQLLFSMIFFISILIGEVSYGVKADNLNYSASISTSTSGTDITFTCNLNRSISGEDIKYQWQEYDGKSWHDISGAKGKTYKTGMADKKGYKYRCNVKITIVEFYSLMYNDYMAFHHRSSVSSEYNGVWDTALYNNTNTSYQNIIFDTIGASPVNEAAKVAMWAVFSEEYMAKYEHLGQSYTYEPNSSNNNTTKQLIVDCYKFLTQRNPTDKDITDWYNVYKSYGSAGGNCWFRDPSTGVNTSRFVYTGMAAVINGIANSPEAKAGMAAMYHYNGDTGCFLYTENDINKRSRTIPVTSSEAGIPTYKVTLEKDTGISSVSGESTYTPGTKVKISASMETNYTFKNWTGDYNESANPYEFYMPGRNVTIKAHATYVEPKYTLTVSKGEGISSVSGGGSYAAGTQVTVTASVKTGYTWSKWSGTLTSTDKSYTFKMPSKDVSLTANASIKTYTMTVNHYQYNINTGKYDYFTKTTDSVSYGSTYTPPYSKTPTGFHNHSRDNDKGWKVTDNKTFNVYYYPNTYTMTMQHYKYNVTTGKWDYMKDTTASVLFGSTYKPSYTETPVGYYNHSIKDGNWKDITDWTVTGNRTFKVFYYPNTYTMTVNHYRYNPNTGGWDFIRTTIDKVLYGTIYIPPYNSCPGGYHNHSRDYDKGWTVSGNGKFTVKYYPDSYNVILRKGTGIEAVSGAGNYLYTQNVTIDATLKKGYHWNNWTGTYNTNNKKYTFQLPIGGVDMTANGVANTYTIHFEPNDGKVKSQVDDITITYDTDMTLPDATDKFIRYTLDGEDITEQVLMGTIVLDEEGYLVENNAQALEIQAQEAEEPKPEKRAYASVFRGWSLEAKRYDFEPQWKAGTVFVNEITETAGVTDTNNAMITLYAVWDDCPWIVAQHLYYTLDQAKSGYITENEILSHQFASDREDGSPIEAGTHDNGTSFTIPDYTPTDFTQFANSGSSTENLTVKDSTGSIYRKQITVYVTDTAERIIEPEGTTRFIDEKYYNMPYEKGGLEENSIWKTEQEYAQKLQKVFANLKNKTPVTSYEITYETRNKIREYVSIHGFGNSMEPDALKNAYAKFLVAD